MPRPPLSSLLFLTGKIAVVARNRRHYSGRIQYTPFPARWGRNTHRTFTTEITHEMTKFATHSGTLRVLNNPIPYLPRRLSGKSGRRMLIRPIRDATGCIETMTTEPDPGAAPSFCGNCGAAMTPSSQICAACGRPATPPPAPTDAPPPDYIPYCRNCGIGVPWGAGHTCRRCGMTPLCRLHFQAAAGLCLDCAAPPSPAPSPAASYGGGRTCRGLRRRRSPQRRILPQLRPARNRRRLRECGIFGLLDPLRRFRSRPDHHLRNSRADRRRHRHFPHLRPNRGGSGGKHIRSFRQHQLQFPATGSGAYPPPTA